MYAKTYSDAFNANTNIGSNGEFLSTKSVVVGEVGANYVLSSPRKVVLFDDFLGDIIDDAWSAAKGTDGQCVIATINAGGNGGTVRLTSGDTTVVAESLSSLTHGLNWVAGNGELIFEAKIKPISAVTTCTFLS